MARPCTNPWSGRPRGNTLLRLSGRTHALRSAVAIALGGAVVEGFVESAHLTLRALTPQAIERYLDIAPPAVLQNAGATRWNRSAFISSTRSPAIIPRSSDCRSSPASGRCDASAVCRFRASDDARLLKTRIVQRGKPGATFPHDALSLEQRIVLRGQPGPLSARCEHRTQKWTPLLGSIRCSFS